jgi:hypothetical protein
MQASSDADCSHVSYVSSSQWGHTNAKIFSRRVAGSLAVTSLEGGRRYSGSCRSISVLLISFTWPFDLLLDRSFARNFILLKLLDMTRDGLHGGSLWSRNCVM